MSKYSAAHVWNRRNDPEAAALAAEVERLREYYAAVQANGGLIENHSSYDCPGWRLGKKYKPCTCGAIERKNRVDAAIVVLAQQKQEG